MKLQDCQIFRLGIPFKVRFSHSLATRTETESILLALADTDGNIGYGEGTPRDYVTGETMHGTAAAIRRVYDDLSGTTIQTIQDVAQFLESAEGLEKAPSARCALELALLDLLGKNTRQTTLAMLGEPQIERVFYSAVISSETPDKVARMAQQVAAMRVRQVKLKVGSDTGLNGQNIRLLREILGDQVEIRADANAAWNLEEAVLQINSLLDAGVFLIEQPLPASDREVWPALQARLGKEAQIYVDESVCTLEDARWLAERNAVAGFNLKVSKHGGILPSLDIHWLAREHGLFCQMGCHVGESSILSAAGRVLAALAGDLRACEGSYGKLLLEQDLSPQPLQVGFQGIGPVSDVQKHPGFGILVDLDLVKAYLSVSV